MYVLALKLALSQLRINFLSRLVVVLSVAVILLINGLVFVLFQGVSKSLAEVRSSQFITAYLDGAVSPAQEPEVLSAVRKVPGVIGAQLVSKDAFLDNFSKFFPQLSSELATLEADTIPRYVKVKVQDGQSDLVQAKLVKLQGIELVELNRKKYSGLIGALMTLRKLAVVLIAGMSIALLCVLLNHFKLRTALQAQVLSTLTLLGAKGGQLLLPFALEGLLEGLLGGLLAGATLLVYGRAFESQLGGLFTAMGYHPYHFELATLALALVVAGMVSGMIGSLWASARARAWSAK